MLRRAVVLCIACCLLNGCATWSRYGIVVPSSGKFRIAVVPIQNNVTIKRLKNIESVPKGTPKPPDEKKQVTEKMQKITEDLSLALTKRLSASPYFEVVPDDKVEEGLRQIGSLPETSLTAKQIQALGKTVDAPLVLTTKLSGYGKIKNQWLSYLLISGAIEGAVDGLVVAVALGNPALAAAVGGEELLQEGLTWGGGGILFNKIFTPVILEGRLYSVADQRKIWSEVAMARTNRKRLKEYPKQERKNRALRLQLTSERSVEELAHDLEKRAKTNLKSKINSKGPAHTEQIVPRQ